MQHKSVCVKYYHNLTLLWRDKLRQFFMQVIILIIMQSKSGIIIYPQHSERERDSHSLNVDTTTLNISAWLSCHIIPPTSRTFESLCCLQITTMSHPNNGFEIWTMYSVWVCFVCNNDASFTIRPRQTIQHLVKACVVSYLEGTFRPWLMFRNGSLIYFNGSWFIFL